MSRHMLCNISDYSDLITVSKTEEIYLNVPLSSLNNRGDIIEDTARKFMEVRTGLLSYNADITQSVSGNKRGRNTTEYDFKIDDQRYEVKSSQLGWDRFKSHWRAVWQNVKKDSHDILLLVLYSPTGLYFYRHDGSYGSTHGKKQESTGGRIQVRGKQNVHDIKEAERVIHKKMEHMYLGCLTFDQVILPEAMSPYQGKPLYEKSAKVRGGIIETIARRFMESYSGQLSHNADITQSISGKKRGRNMTEYDFKIDDQRYEVKSAQLGWDRIKSRWKAIWSDVKRDCHDILLLVLYSPTGLYFYKHDGSFGISTNGKIQESCGILIQVYGKRHDHDIKEAEGVIHNKMKHMFLGKIEF